MTFFFLPESLIGTQWGHVIGVRCITEKKEKFHTVSSIEHKAERMKQKTTQFIYYISIHVTNSACKLFNIFDQNISFYTRGGICTILFAIFGEWLNFEFKGPSSIWSSNKTGKIYQNREHFHSPTTPIRWHRKKRVFAVLCHAIKNSSNCICTKFFLCALNDLYVVYLWPWLCALVICQVLRGIAKQTPNFLPANLCDGLNASHRISCTKEISLRTSQMLR